MKFAPSQPIDCAFDKIFNPCVKLKDNNHHGNGKLSKIVCLSSSTNQGCEGGGLERPVMIRARKDDA